MVLLYGDKGTGKSMIPILLSKEFKNVNFCDTFKPYEPGNNFSSLYNKTNPDKNSPLIVVLEEFDIIIDKIHYNKIVNHKYIPTEITDKSSWNLFFDRFDRGYYPHVILILTSNIKPTFINNLDESYIREGRVNLLFEVIL